MKFSIVLALLPLALAAPNPAAETAAAAAAPKEACCSDCTGSLYKTCRDGCWDRGYFSYCTYACVDAMSTCLDHCKPCKA